MALLALRFGRQPVNAVLVVPLRTRSEFAMWVTAEMVSLVPGSLLIEISRSRWALQVHVLDTPDLAAVQRARDRVWAQERRVVEAFGDAEDIARVRQPPPDRAASPPTPAHRSRASRRHDQLVQRGGLGGRRHAGRRRACSP